MTVSLPKSGEPLSHYVSTAPFDPHSVDVMTEEQSKIYQASQLRLMWWKFKKHRLALFSLFFLVFLYATIAIVEFLAPYNLHTRNVDFIHSPPQSVHLFHDGKFVGPFVYGREMTLDMDTLRRIYTDKPDKVEPIRFFCRGDGYKFWGLVQTNIHLACPAKDGQLFLLGSDRLGRDVLSRILYGARISLTIGLLGITMSFVLGITIGGLAGYHGGVFDLITQRIIEVLQSIPSIPLWMALAAIMPVTWSPILIYLGITAILGLLDWTGLARAVRSKLLALREEDYVLAAQLMGRFRPHHRPSPGTRLHVAPDRHGNAGNPRHGPWRDGAELPWPWSSPADHQLGHSFDRSPQRQRHCFLSLAVVSNHSGHSRDSGVQFSGRRTARCCRSV